MNLGMRRAALVALAVARACDYELTFDGARVSISVESIEDVPRAAEAMVDELIHTLKTGQYGCGFASCFDELVRTDVARACFSQPAPVYVPPPAPWPDAWPASPSPSTGVVVLASGSCRLLTALGLEAKRAAPRYVALNAIHDDNDGPTHVGKLHNAAQHSLLLDLILENPPPRREALAKVLTAFLPPRDRFSIAGPTALSQGDVAPNRTFELRRRAPSADAYFFEVSSLKRYRRDGRVAHAELLDPKDLEAALSTPFSSDELVASLVALAERLPKEALVVFSGHLRPQLYDDAASPIPSRERIWGAILEAVDVLAAGRRVVAHDPSVVACVDPGRFVFHDADPGREQVYGSTHWTPAGHAAHHAYLYARFISGLRPAVR